MKFPTYFLRHSLLNWQVLSTLALGVLLAVALLASGPLIVDTVLDLGIRRTLVTSDPQDANLHITTSMNLTAKQYMALNDQVQSLLRTHLGDYVGYTIPSGETQWAYPVVNDEVQSRERLNLHFYGLDWGKVPEKVTFIAGNLPGSSELGEGVLAGVINEKITQHYDVGVGDEITISSQPNTSAPQLRIKVAGILKPKDAQDHFWYGSLSPLQSHSDTRYDPQYNLLISSEDFLETAAALFPSSNVELSWYAILDPGQVNVDNLPDLQDQINSIDLEVKDLSDDLRLETGLPDLIAEAIPQLEGVRTPLYFLISTVVLLALYYVVMAATLSTQQSQREFAVLRSRGASKFQLASLKLIEALIICSIAFLSGPGLALLLMRGLVLYGPLADLAKSDWVFQLPQAAWLAAIVGSVACLVSLLGPLPNSIGKSIVTHSAALSRSEREPWWQFYYVDVIITVVGLILLWRLNLYGGILDVTGASTRVDWLLLLSPLALLLGAATITLRLFPLLLDLGAAVMRQGRGLSGALALWQAARNPVHVTRLVLLLTLAMALGMLSSGLNTALDRNEHDRSIYAVGSDVHVILPEARHSTAGEGTVRNIGKVIDTVPEVTKMTGALRMTGSLRMTIENIHPPFDLFAIDPDDFQDVTSLREDYAEEPIDRLLDDLSVEETQGLSVMQLPGHPTNIGLWLMIPFKGLGYVSPVPPTFNVGYVLRESASFEDITLMAKLRTAQSETFTLHLYPEGASKSQNEGWMYYEGALPPLAASSYPVDLISFWVKTRDNPRDEYRYFLPRLALDDFSIKDSESGETITFEGFETDNLLWFTDDPELILSIERGYSHSGETHLLLDYWENGVMANEWVILFAVEEPVERQIIAPPPTQVGEDEEEVLLPIPSHPQKLGLWLAIPLSGLYQTGAESSWRVGNLSDMDVEVRLQTFQEETVILPLEFIKESDVQVFPDFPYWFDLPWHYFETDVPIFPEESYPLMLSSIAIRFDPETMVPLIKIDDVTLVVHESAEAIILADFEGDTASYWSLKNGNEVGFADRSGGCIGDSSCLMLTLKEMGRIRDVGWVSITPRETPVLPISNEEESIPSANESEDIDLATFPVLVNQKFLDVTQVKIGDYVGAWIESQPYRLEIVGVVKYFPTLFETQDTMFVITDVNPLIEAINFLDYIPTSVNEYFISLQPNSSIETYGKLRNLFGDDVEVLDAESLRKTIKSDPLALGLRSVTFLGYILTTVLSLVGFSTYFYVSVRQRRKMYSVLRVLGLSPSQLYGTLLLEQLILIFSSLALGTGLGLLLNRLTLPGLPISLGGHPPIPPFLAEIEWLEIGKIYLTLALAFIVSLGLATLLLSRIRLHRIIRIDEE